LDGKDDSVGKCGCSVANWSGRYGPYLLITLGRKNAFLSRGHYWNRPGTARRFLNEGSRVAIAGKNPANLDAARRELGSNVLVLASHAGDATAQKRLKRVHVLSLTGFAETLSGGCLHHSAGYSAV
jgi:hypothetical protein